MSDNALETTPNGVESNVVLGWLKPTRFEVSAQGSLLKVVDKQTRTTPNQPKKTSRRGKVSGQSAKSRKRLLEHVATLSNKSLLVFITVTYRTAPTVEDAKRNLHAFLERIRYRAPKAAVIWKMEYQERGAIHFHLLCWNVPYWEKRQVQAAWGEITGEHMPFTRIEAIRQRRKALAYVAKYMAKRERSGGFNYVPYSQNWTGRTWGMRQKENFEYAPKQTIRLDPIIHRGIMRADMLYIYKEIRLKASKIFKPIANYEFIGFTLFCDDPYSFLKDLTVYEIPVKIVTT